MLFFLLILFISRGFPEQLEDNPSTYGRAIEYRYQYDGRKNNKPIVEVKYGNINARDFDTMLASSPTIFSMKTGVQKAPNKYLVDDYFIPIQNNINLQKESRSPYDQWMNTVPFSHELGMAPTLPGSKRWETVVHTLNEPEDLMEMISSYMRQQSEDIFTEHFLKYPNIVPPHGQAPTNLPRNPFQFDSGFYHKFT